MSQIPNVVKIRPVRAELFIVGGRSHRRTDMMNVKVTFRSFANAPNKNHCLKIHSLKDIHNRFMIYLLGDTNQILIYSCTICKATEFVQ